MKCKHRWISGDRSTCYVSFCCWCGETKNRITKLSKIAKKALRRKDGTFLQFPGKTTSSSTSGVLTWSDDAGKTIPTTEYLLEEINNKLNKILEEFNNS
jgi:hypothetical protein